MSGMNGQQLKEFYANAFEVWKETQSDDDFMQIIYRGQLSRKEMAKAIGSQTSVFRQNPVVKESLQNLEDTLRERGVLPPLVQSAKTNTNEPKEYSNKATTDILNIKRLAELEAENIELKAKVEQLEKQLEKYGELSETLSEMGFIPR
ncbi:VPA1267 family protein [Pseudoalteromonas sp. JC28]|uniref:VPA1267 family protein n=1 Tax=Pseudoalteromonas sp. JC28 TaxID=2267617 RepID=UPI0020C5CC7E|nr:VPA1267 family protein [Pseudoalteromonas sp. JC28]